MNTHSKGSRNPGLILVLAASVTIGVLVTGVAQAGEAMTDASSHRHMASSNMVIQMIEQWIGLNPGKKIHNWVPSQTFSQRPVLSFTTLLPAHIETQPGELTAYLSLGFRW